MNGEGDETQCNRWFRVFEAYGLEVGVLLDYIFYPDGPELSAPEVLDATRAYRPTVIAL